MKQKVKNCFNLHIFQNMSLGRLNEGFCKVTDKLLKTVKGALPRN